LADPDRSARAGRLARDGRDDTLAPDFPEDFIRDAAGFFAGDFAFPFGLVAIFLLAIDPLIVLVLRPRLWLPQGNLLVNIR